MGLSTIGAAFVVWSLAQRDFPRSADVLADADFAPLAPPESPVIASQESFTGDPTAVGAVETRSNLLSFVPTPALDLGHPGYEPLKEKLRNEPVDPDWAPGIESQIYGGLSTVGFAFMSAEVHCRTTICQLNLLIDATRRADEDFITILFRDVLQPVFSEHGLNRMQGGASADGRATFYVSKSNLFAGPTYDLRALRGPESNGGSTGGLQISFDELQNVSAEELEERLRQSVGPREP